jgi:hypothetical protein
LPLTSKLIEHSKFCCSLHPFGFETEPTVKRSKNLFSLLPKQIPILARKLKALKVDLRDWNEEVFGNEERNKKLILDDFG